MHQLTGKLIWALFALGCIGAALFSWYLSQSNRIFLATNSPNKTYAVNLKGNPGRALVMGNEVWADIYKDGNLVLRDVWLHTTRNSFDLSFEAGFPDHRWLSENVVEFYRPGYFERGADHLEVKNQTDTPVKYLRVESYNKFLILDLQPKSSVSLKVPLPRADWQWFFVEGSSLDGKLIPENSKKFDRHGTQRQTANYQIVFTTAGSIIEMRW